MNLVKNIILTSAITKEIAKFPPNRKLRISLPYAFIKPVAALYATIMTYIRLKKFSVNLSPFLLLLFPLFLSLLIHSWQYNSRNEGNRISEEKPGTTVHSSTAFPRLSDIH